MPMIPINPSHLPLPIAPYSAAAAANGIVYVSGILALGEGGAVLHAGDATAQTRHVLDTIDAILAEAGGSLSDITFNHVFLTDWADYAAINAVYAEYFPTNPPARYCVQVGLVKPGLLVEIASVAHIAPR